MRETKPRQSGTSPRRRRGTPPAMSAPVKLKLLFTVVNRPKAELYADLLQSFGVNMQLLLAASGTATAETLRHLGIPDTEKTVIVSAIRADRAGEALAMLEEKFRTIRGGKGIAYTVPFDSTIGVAIYQFLSDNRAGIAKNV